MTRRSPKITPAAPVEDGTDGVAPSILRPNQARMGYRQISAELISEIHAGEWPVGAKLPPEAALVDRFGVSRNTVREALRELRDLGYLSKRRGTPSVIVRAVPNEGFVNSIQSIDQLLEYASAAHNVLLSAEIVILMDEQARRLDCAPRSEWLRMQFLRHRTPDDLPFCYSEVFVAPRFADIVDTVGSRQAAYAAIERKHGGVIAKVVQEIDASAATEFIALRLQVPVGSPIMLAKSSFYASDGELIEIGLAHFAAGRYRLRVALDRPDNRTKAA